MSRSLTPATVKVYLSAVNSWYQRKGLRSLTSHNPVLKLVLKGAKKQHALDRSPRYTRQPITLNILHRLLRHTRSSHCHLHVQDKDMLAAAFILVFFGLLRISEFTVPSKQKFDARNHPTMADITWKHQHYCLNVKHSKTDQLGRGHVLCIPKARGIICPFSAMRKYFKSCSKRISLHSKPAPLFTFRSGQPLTRHSCLKWLRQMLTQLG